MQVLNVALGGSLHQHLPDHEGGVDHRQQRAERRPTHRVTLARDSRLTKVFGRRYLEVNSFHHQGLHSLGKGLAIAGHAPDGQSRRSRPAGGASRSACSGTPSAWLTGPSTSRCSAG